jgi:hypothetical protein
MWEGLKKIGKKQKNKKQFLECLSWHSGKRYFPECWVVALGEEVTFPEC